MSATAQRAFWASKKIAITMKSLTNKSPCLQLLIAGTAASLLSGAGIARIPGCNPVASGGVGNIFSTVELSAIKLRCIKCRMTNEATFARW